MGARRLGRIRALQALYHLDINAGSPEEALASAWASEEDPRDAESESFARELLEGVIAHLEEVDGLIQKHSHNWRLDRMARIDRNVLRLAIFELKHRTDIPRKVTLNEAVELGKLFGAEGSASFINGLLDRVAVELGKQ